MTVRIRVAHRLVVRVAHAADMTIVAAVTWAAAMLVLWLILG